MNDHITIETFGEHGLLLNWPSAIDSQINDEVHETDNFICKLFPKEIIETVPAYHSLAIYLQENVKPSKFIELLRDTIFVPENKHKRNKNVVTIPVCYKPQIAPDIKDVINYHGITITELIKLHTQPLYKVYFLGFLPGFPYLGGLDEKICTPRKATPSKFIERGSVAIGGDQTGIYTMQSPGGWNVIGRSPLEFFSVNSKSLSLLRPGDYVKFKSITLKEFERIESEIASGDYKPRREEYYD